jgi:hypothetical protein
MFQQNQNISKAQDQDQDQGIQQPQQSQQSQQQQQQLLRGAQQNPNIHPEAFVPNLRASNDHAGEVGQVDPQYAQFEAKSE